MALSKRVSVAVSPQEYKALQWVAQREQLQRYPGSRSPKKPGRGAVLRKMSVERAVELYLESKTSQAGTTTEAAGE